MFRVSGSITARSVWWSTLRVKSCLFALFICSCSVFCRCIVLFGLTAVSFYFLVAIVVCNSTSLLSLFLPASPISFARRHTARAGGPGRFGGAQAWLQQVGG